MERPDKLKKLTPTAIMVNEPPTIDGQLALLDACLEWLHDDHTAILAQQEDIAQKLFYAKHDFNAAMDIKSRLEAQYGAARGAINTFDPWASQQVEAAPTNNPVLAAAAAELAKARQSVTDASDAMDSLRTKSHELDKLDFELKDVSRWVKSRIERKVALLRGTVADETEKNSPAFEEAHALAVTPSVSSSV